MESRRILLVTGCCGFMGSWIADYLADVGHHVAGIDNFSGGTMDNYTGDYELYAIDLRNARDVERVIKKERPEIIYHLAACAREGASQFQPLYVTQTNYQAYMNLLEPAIKYGLDKIILFSSMAVYGAQQPPFTEDMPRMPEDIYGINKAAMEHSTEVLADVHEFKYVILRPHNVFGERQCLSDKFRNVIAIFMNRIMWKEPLYIYGDGNQKRAFSYILDSLPCYIRAMDDDITNEIINIGGKVPITINHLADVVCEAMGVPPEDYPRKYLPPRPREVKEAWCSWEKSVKLLGYDEKIGYKEGIKRMAIWAWQQGRQDWTDEKLPLESDKMPSVWR